MEKSFFFLATPSHVVVKGGKLCLGSSSTEGKEENLWPSFQRNPLVSNVVPPDSIGSDVGQWLYVPLIRESIK